MLKIFAKYRTDEKVLIQCQQHQIPHIIRTLNKNYGSDWLPVDDLSDTEILHFNDGLIYQGYSSKIKRYCDAIDTL